MSTAAAESTEDKPIRREVTAPYMRWAKTHRRATWDMTGSNLLACTLDDLPEAREALELAGDNDNGYRPLLEAVGARYHVSPDMVTTAAGTSGANFLVAAALLEPGDDVLVERPGYDPLTAVARIFGATVRRFERRFENGFALDPDEVRLALRPTTRLIVLTSPHNPSGVIASSDALDAVGRLAESVGARVLVDEVYLDAAFDSSTRPAATRSPVFITTNSLTKAYGLAGLRCGWVIAAPEVTARVARMHDLVDAIGAFPAERLALAAFRHLDRLAARAHAHIERNGRLVRDFLRSRADLEWVDGPLGLVLFPRVRGVEDASPLVERWFERHDVGVVAGRFFDLPAHFRIAMGGRTEVIAGALERLGRALDEA